MENRRAWSLCLATVSVLIFASCGSGNKPASSDTASPKAPETKAESHDGRGHEAAGEDNCIVIDIGQHEFLGDLDFDPESGTVVLSVNSHATQKPYPHTKAEALLNVVLESGTVQIPLVADPAQGDPEGKTSRYKATAAALKGVKGAKALKGRVNLTIDGKAYLCDLAGGH